MQTPAWLWYSGRQLFVISHTVDQPEGTWEFAKLNVCVIRRFVNLETALRCHAVNTDVMMDVTGPRYMRYLVVYVDLRGRVSDAGCQLGAGGCWLGTSLWWWIIRHGWLGTDPEG